MRCAGFVPPALRVRWRACAGENCQDSYMYEPMYRTQSQSLLAFALLGRI